MKWNFSIRYLLSFIAWILLAFTLHAQSIPCEYRLELFDNGGDGWNGASLIVTINGDANSYTLNNMDDDGSFTVFNIQVNDGDTLSLRFVPGAANEEVIYSIYDPNDQLLFSDGPFPIVGELITGIISCPSCPPPPPNDILIEEVSSSTADISFRLSDPDGGYIIEYDTTGFEPGNGNFLLNYSGDTTITGLNEKTIYDFYLSAACANGDTSQVLGPFSFETLWSIDVGISDIATPITNCALGTNEEVNVAIENFGSNPQSLIPFKYSVNGVEVSVSMPQDGLYTGVLGKDSADVFPFDARFNFSEPQEYVVSAWTELEGDRDNSNDTASVTIINIPFVQDYPYFENFEVWNGGWTVNQESQNASWEFGQPDGSSIDQAFSGNNAWITNLQGSYLNNELSYLESPCLDFSSFTEDPSISFFLNFITEECCDRIWLESSIDGGENWNKVGSAGSGTNWYNDEINEAWAGTGGFDGWAFALNVLTGLAGQSDVRLRFVFLSDLGVANEGVGIDDIFIGIPLDNDLVMVGANNLGDECGNAADSLTVRVGNYGQASLNEVIVSYQVNNDPPVTETISDINLDAGEEINYTFQTPFNSSPTGSYEITVWTDQAGEVIRQNDTTRIRFSNALALPFAEDFEDRNELDSWMLDSDVLLTGGHNNTSTVLSDNLWNLDQTLTAITPPIGPIVSGDSLNFEYRYVDFDSPFPAVELGEGDTLSVAVSTDCGVSYTTIYQVSAANHLNTEEMTPVRISLEDYVGMAIKIRFFAVRRNAGDYYVDIDNVNVFQCQDLLLRSEISNATAANANDGSVRVIPGRGLPPFTYEWSNGDVSNTATQLMPGIYEVLVTDRLGCSSFLEVTVDISTSTEEQEWLENISLAPNPVSDIVYLNLQTNETLDLQLELIDLFGQRLWVAKRRQVLGENNWEIDLSNYPNGIYFIRLLGENKLKTLKVIKQ